MLTKHLWSDEVERLTGIPARSLSQEATRKAMAGVKQAYG